VIPGWGTPTDQKRTDEERTMASKLGPLEVVCDSPPYHIVRACRLIGLQKPEDVRWMRMRNFLREKREEDNGMHSFFQKLLWSSERMKDATCTCGEHLPILEKYVFTLFHHGDLYYLLAQCSRCKTIFWEED
jgi:hypothetical protein